MTISEKVLKSLLVLTLIGSCPARAADVEEVPVPDLKGGVEQAVGVKEGFGNYSIIWDRWRNKVIKEVWERFCINLKGGGAVRIGQLFLKTNFKKNIEFPKSMGATFSFDVEDGRKIKDVKIVSSSGNAEYDNLIIKSVEYLNGKSILDFPAGTERKTVTLSSRLVIKKNGTFHGTEYNDIEKIEGQGAKE
ncbi:MAG: hypothetical protein SFY67_08700 [Candidatus Melainabacteria bacterium]|nr:hypothetical protein [Candidatus Melainabacteria bacterium]